MVCIFFLEVLLSFSASKKKFPVYGLMGVCNHRSLIWLQKPSMGHYCQTQPTYPHHCKKGSHKQTTRNSESVEMNKQQIEIHQTENSWYSCQPVPKKIAMCSKKFNASLGVLIYLVYL